METVKEKFIVPPEREVKTAPSRYRNSPGKFKLRRNSKCISCGRCVELCPYGVHQMREGYKYISSPGEFYCIGFDCENTDHFCVEHCPQDALELVTNPIYESIGDYRWTADLILSTWFSAETGDIPPDHLQYKTGGSGGGFDRIRFDFESTDPLSDTQDIDLSVELNKRGDDAPPIRIDIPFYGGGMSFGSISINTMLARARAYTAWNSFTCTGEGGYPQRLYPYDDNVITQVATGLFGVREETIQRVKVVEFKYAQGAKPGLGGHLLGDKVTREVANIREAVEGSALFSPFPFHSVYSVEDHKKHVDWIKSINPSAVVSVKVSTPTDVDMVAVGSYYAGAHIIHLDGSYGGTGAAPDIAKKNIAMPVEFAIPIVHKFLVGEGVRDEMTVVASGGIRTSYDVAKAIALGADACVIGTSELVALGCIRCRNCERGRGCPRGIATTDEELYREMDLDWATQRLINLFFSWSDQLKEILKRLGLKSIKELVGRTDLLIHLDYE